jgi:hypothetical protein
MIPPLEGCSRECDGRPEKGPKKIFGPEGAVVSQVREETRAQAIAPVTAMTPDPEPVGNGTIRQPPSTAVLVTGAIVAALVLSVARVFVLKRVFGYAAENQERGGWSLLTTFVLLSVALVSFVLCSNDRRATTIFRSMGWAMPVCITFGVVYGLFTRALLSGAFCGVCIGCGVGYVAGLNGIAPRELNTGDGKKLLAIAFAFFTGFGMLGFLTPIPLMPNSVYRANRKAAHDREAAAAASATPSPEATTQVATVGQAYKDPDKQAVYEKGWDEGVMLAREWLNGIERKANGQPVKEYLKSNPSHKWNAEQQSDALMKQQLACASVVPGIYQSLVNRGMLSDLNKHPDVVAAEKRNAFASGKMAGFNATFMPLLKD